MTLYRVTMKTNCLLLVFMFLERAASTHLETCECHEIKSLVNASIEQAIARLENKMTVEINSAITKINKTDDKLEIENILISYKEKLYGIESSLISTAARLENNMTLEINLAMAKMNN